ncbi:hypothetical protein FOXYSP1_16587 [Fusarium oxysporum f. sp. phaseoli]
MVYSRNPKFNKTLQQVPSFPASIAPIIYFNTGSSMYLVIFQGSRIILQLAGYCIT